MSWKNLAGEVIDLFRRPVAANDDPVPTVDCALDDFKAYVLKYGIRTVIQPFAFTGTCGSHRMVDFTTGLVCASYGTYTNAARFASPVPCAQCDIEVHT